MRKLTITLTLACLCSVLLFAGGARTDFGVPIYPGAKSQPAVAKAVEAYYKPGVSNNQQLVAGVFESPASFEELYNYYGPRMDQGKFGWRKKTRLTIQMTETLKFMRAELLAAQGGDRKLPAVFRSFFGDPSLSEEQFNQRLDQLKERHKDVRFRIVEGTRRIRGANASVKITIERPYLDLQKMRVIDKSRIVLVKVTDHAAQSQPSASADTPKPSQR